MNLNLLNITNQYQDVKLVSLSTWRQANEITPRDHNGPYVVTQEGYDRDDPKVIPDEFILGRSGKWLSLGHFFQIPVADRRSEFVFGTVSEVIQFMSNLPSDVEMLRPLGKEKSHARPDDEMAKAFQAGRPKQSAAAHSSI